MAGVGLPGPELHLEMEILVEAGMTPMQVLQATTVNTATFLRVEKDLGTVQAGRLADLVVMGADPLAEIANTQKIELVMKDGKEIDRTFHREYDPIIKFPLNEDRIIPMMPVVWRGSPFFRKAVVFGLKPMLATEGASDVEVTLDGMGFSGSSVVSVATSRLKTTHVGPDSYEP